jgi:hypothetical protein
MQLLRRIWPRLTLQGDQSKQAKVSKKGFASLAKRLDRLEAQIEDVHKLLRQDARWKTEIRGKIDALLRLQYLPDLGTGDYPFALLAKRFHLISQNEEDGMTLALLAAAGVTGRTFVEIGSGINGGNSGFLAEEFGWRGLMVEMNPERAAQCRRRFGDPGRVTCISAEVNPGNVNALLAEHGFTGEIDLFSLDIDSFDYWVFEAMTVCSPRVLILEYNGYFGPDRAVTIPLGASLEGAP